MSPCECIINGMKLLHRFIHGLHTTSVLVLGAVIMIIMVWVLSFLRLWQDKQFVIEQAHANVQNIAISFKEHSLASVRNTDQALRIIKYHYELNGSKDFGLLNGYFDQGVIDFSFLNQVGIINEQGIYEFSNLKNHKKVDLSDREHFQFHKQNAASPLFISKPVLGRASGKWSIQLTRRLNYPDGRFKGVAVASFNPNYFLDFHRQIDLGQDSSISLIGLDGYVRTLRLGGMVRFDDSMLRLNLPKQFLNANDGWFISDQFFDHIKRLYVFARLNDQPLFVLVGMRETEVLAEYNRLQSSYMQASSVLTFLIVLFVTVAVFFIRRAEKINAQLRLSYEELDAAKQHEIEMSSRLTQSEKLAALGQLAAVVAHEINNPMAFVASNLTTLHKYADVIAKLMQAAQQLQEQQMTAQEFENLKKTLNFDFVLSDLRTILDETQEGVVRVKHIVDDLKNFARGDPQQAWVMSDIRHGIESTLNIVNHEIKYRAEVVWDWQDLPLMECIPSQINQVFLNLIVNAAQAMPSERVGTITLCSGIQGKTIWIEVRDNGAGMTEDVLSRIFEPFYTTKAVGVGTGLGLSVSLGIVQRHHGQLTVSSELGRGTTLRVVLPLRQK